MTIEEKARKYDDALKRAEAVIKVSQNQKEVYGCITTIFPELAESEDEKIRKTLIRYMASVRDIDGIKGKDIITWLEKQKVTDEEIIFRPIVGTDIRIAAKQAIEKIDIGKKVVLAFNGAYIPVNGKTVGEIDSEYDAWLEEQGEKLPVIRWYDVSLIPQEGEELLVEWDSEDATWHEIAFYHADTKTFWNGERQVKNVTKWCYIIDLLEKQDEQKPTDKAEPKFKIGDWITFYGSKMFKILKVESEQNGILDYLLVSQDGHESYYNKNYVDTNARLWTIQDAKDGDVLMANAPFIFNGNLEGGIGCPGAHCGINTLGEFKIPTNKKHWTGHITIPATKEQRELLFSKMKEAGYEWDAEKKELYISL